MSLNVRKRTFWHVHPPKTHINLRISAVWLESSLSERRKLHPWLFKMRPVKILIRLRECAVWSESSLGAHARRYVFWRRGSYRNRTVSSFATQPAKREVDERSGKTQTSLCVPHFDTGFQYLYENRLQCRSLPKKSTLIGAVLVHIFTKGTAWCAAATLSARKNKNFADCCLLQLPVLFWQTDCMSRMVCGIRILWQLGILWENYVMKQNKLRENMGKWRNETEQLVGKYGKMAKWNRA